MAAVGLVQSAQDIIKKAMRLIGVIAAGEPLNDSEGQDGLAALNQMVDSWNAEHLMIFTNAILEFPLISGQQTYTLGTGGNFNADRPSRIDAASIISLANPVQPLELPIGICSDLEWASIPVKAVGSSLPNCIYDDNGYPFRTLSFWPYPNTAPVSVRLYCWTSVSAFADLTTTYAFPPGYAEALSFNLAICLAPEYPLQTPVSQIVIAKAVETKARIKTANFVPSVLSIEGIPSGNNGRFYNWLSDQPVSRP